MRSDLPILVAILYEAMTTSERPSEITVYTTIACPYCVRVKRLLDAEGLAYTEVNLGRDEQGRMELVQRTGMMTFPQVLIDDKLLGDFEQTKALAERGLLREIVGQ